MKVLTMLLKDHQDALYGTHTDKSTKSFVQPSRLCTQ